MSSWNGTLTSSGLFVGTVLLTLWWKEKRQQTIYLEDTRFVQRYSQRRIEDRLSFHELDRRMLSDDDECNGGSADADSFEGETSRENYPTNSNWNHFEGYHCSDEEEDVCEVGSVGPSLSSPTNEFNPPSFPKPTRTPGERRSVSVGSSSSSKPPSRRPSLFSKLPQLLPLRRTNSVPGLATSPNDTPKRRASNQVRNRAVRSKYNASIMPNQIIMIRHGQSIGNVDEKLYATTADNAMPLTHLGWEQSMEAGRKVREMTHGENVHFIMSPYVRTVETFHGMASAWCDPNVFAHIVDRDVRLKAWYGRLMEMGLTWTEDPRIREQDFGNYQEPDKIKQAKRDRYRFGAFYYRFPYGESASDVFDRVSTFLDSLWRSFDTNNSRNYVLVTHGISIRVILARYFRYTIDQFHLLLNPRNCEMVSLRHDGTGRLELDGCYELEMTDSDKGTRSVVGYKYRRRLRVLPQSSAKKVLIRMSYADNAD